MKQMKIRELLKVLTELNPELDVLVSSDKEGNSYSLLEDAELMRYIEGDDGVEVFIAGLSEELREEGYTEEDIRLDATPCLVLWP